METAARKFVKRVIDQWGTPRVISADNAFKGAFSEMCKNYGIKIEHSLPYQHVGLVKWYNCIVNEMLRNETDGNDLKWDQHLSKAQFAINTYVMSGHGFSAMKLATTRDPIPPIVHTVERGQAIQMEQEMNFEEKLNDDYDDYYAI